MTETSYLTPDLVRPLVGFRQWRLRDGVLYSMWTDDPWPGGQLSGRCRGSCDCEAGIGVAPDPDCTCGVHAWHRQVPLGASANRDLVAGAVALWGAVEVHAIGMRAQFARIVTLALPVTRGRKRLEVAIVAGEMGIDLVPHRHLVAAEMAHGTPVPPSLRPRQRSDPRRLVRQIWRGAALESH
jgi:hypothetical protein